MRAEAEHIHHGQRASDIEVDKSWAEVEVRTPFEGVILEKNIVAGDIVDTTLDLFKVADLSLLGVMANVYEEDLPALEALDKRDRRWTVRLKAQPEAAGIAGEFDLIGHIVDPNQHTAAVMGWLDNRDGRLRAGQFVTAEVELPLLEVEVELPASAVMQDGERSVVFVAADAKGTEVKRRVVAVAGRGDGVVYVCAQPKGAQLSEGCQPLLPGEWVVAAGIVELDGALETALATAPEGLAPRPEEAH